VVTPDSGTDAAGDDVLDEAGRRWTTRWARWCDAEQVRLFLRRDQDVLVRSSTGAEVTRLSAQQARAWWQGVHRCFGVPGQVAPVSSAGGLTWAAHVWRCEDGGDPARLLVFETFC